MELLTFTACVLVILACATLVIEESRCARNMRRAEVQQSASANGTITERMVPEYHRGDENGGLDIKINMWRMSGGGLIFQSSLRFVAVLAFACMPTVANADIVHMTLQQPTTPAPYGDYVDPYPILVSGSSGSSVLQLACDDYAKNIWVGLEWDADRYTLGQVNTNPALAKFGASASQWAGYSVKDLYNAVAVLTVDLLLHPANQISDSYAAWAIFDPTFIPSPPPPSVVSAAHVKAAATLAAVKAHAPTYLYSSVYIYSPTPAGASQEFIGYVPDGGLTVILLGGALVGLETLRRKLKV